MLEIIMDKIDWWLALMNRWAEFQQHGAVGYSSGGIYPCRNRSGWIPKRSGALWNPCLIMLASPAAYETFP
jgi:hypothetical protein